LPKKRQNARIDKIFAFFLHKSNALHDYEPELDAKTQKNVEVVVESDEAWNEIFYPTVPPQNLTESSSSRMITGMVGGGCYP